MLNCGRRSFSTGCFISNNVFKHVKGTSKSLMMRSVTTSSVLETKNFDGALPVSEIPGPIKVPLIGNIYQFMRAGGIQKFNVAIEQMQEKYGDIFQLKLGSERIVCISNPDMIEDVYRKEGQYPRREKSFPAWDKFHKKNNLPIGVFLMEDEEWHRHRSALNKKLMNVKQVEHYNPDFNKVIDRFMRKILTLRNDKLEIEHIEKELFKWSLESVCTVLFETHIGCFSSRPDPHYQEFINAVHVLFDVVLDLMFQPPLLDKVVETKPVKDFNQSMTTIYKLCDIEIQRKLKAFKEEHGDTIDKDLAKQFIPYLFYVEQMNLADIKSDIASLMMAAVDTTSTTSQMLLFNLANNQAAQTKLYEEISTHLKPDEPATTEVLKKMPYVRAVIKETMRLHPVVPFNGRWFKEDKCIAGYKLPAKTWIFLLHGIASHDKANFDDPEEFKPERWLRDERENKINPFVSLPFGYGVRMCLGRRLAELEMQLLLARIFGKYVVECDHESVKMGTSGALSKPDVPLKFKIYER